MSRKIVLSLIVFSLMSALSAFGQVSDLQQRNKAIEKRAAEIVSMLSENPQSIGRPVTDRDAWEKLAREKECRNVVKNAEKILKTAIPVLPESLYKEFYQNGNRSRYQNERGKKYRRVETFVLAECFENKGRFIAPLEETVRSICNDPSWLLPAHDSNADVYDGKTMYIDLASAAASVELALTVSWLGDKLSPEIRKLIVDNIEKRTFQPYEASVKTGEPKRNWWIWGTNNWNTVCHADVVGAALSLIESPERRAWYIASSEYFMNPFFRGFTPDGYCSEGMGYWNYGYGHFAQLAEIVWQATEGKVDFMTMPKVRNCSLFGALMEVAPGQFAAFADCGVTARPSPSLVKYLSRRLKFGFRDYEKTPITPGTLKSTGVYCFPNSAEATPQAPAAEMPVSRLRTEFPDAGVLIGRPGGQYDSRNKSTEPTRLLAFVCKAGHNAEHHNHNDVGSFTVMFGGKLPLLDPGGEVYTRRTFSKDRYVSKLLNSYGHPVPVVNEKLQRTGRKYDGKILSTSFSNEKDVCVMDIAPAYGQKELKKLERTFEYTRPVQGSEAVNRLTVTDLVELSPAGTFEAALLTYEPWKKSGGNPQDGRIELTIGEKENAVKVVLTADAAEKALPLEFEAVEIDENASARKKPTRFGFKIKQPIEKARIVVTITPAP